MEGCATQELPESWYPLTTVVERKNLPGVPEDVVTTVTPYLYVSSLEWFEENYPDGSFYSEALRRHERQHALEQEAYIGEATGLKRAVRLADWIQEYLTNKSFRWEVEKRGYREELLYLLSLNYPVDAAYFAEMLSSDVYKGMVDYDVALEWVEAVLRGEA